MSAVLALLVTLQAGADDGTYVIREDTVSVAHETFRCSPIRTSDGGTGWNLAATARYDRTRPAVVLTLILESADDGRPFNLTYDVADPHEPRRILGQLVRGRFAVRALGRSTEHTREFLLVGHTVVLDDSVFALYRFAAALRGPTPVAVIAMVPRAGRRDSLTVRDWGVAQTTLNRDPAALRHVTVEGGANRLVHLWLAADGRLLKIEIPDRHVTVERAPGG